MDSSVKHDSDKLHTIPVDEAEEAEIRREAKFLREALKSSDTEPPESLSPDRITALLEENPHSIPAGKPAARRRWALLLTACAAGLMILLPVGSHFFPMNKNAESPPTTATEQERNQEEYATKDAESAPFEDFCTPPSSACDEMVPESNRVTTPNAQSSKDYDSTTNQSEAESCNDNSVSLGNVHVVVAAQVEPLLRGGALLVDVREPEEYKAGHIPDAVNLPLGKLKADINSVADTDRELVVYCRTGVRSRTAAEELAELGYTVYDLGGITTDWPYATVTSGT